MKKDSNLSVLFFKVVAVTGHVQQMAFLGQKGKDGSRV